MTIDRLNTKPHLNFFFSFSSELLEEDYHRATRNVRLLRFRVSLLFFSIILLLCAVTYLSLALKYGVQDPHLWTMVALTSVHLVFCALIAFSTFSSTYEDKETQLAIVTCFVLSWYPIIGLCSADMERLDILFFVEIRYYIFFIIKNKYEIFELNSGTAFGIKQI